MKVYAVIDKREIEGFVDNVLFLHRADAHDVILSMGDENHHHYVIEAIEVIE